MAFGTVKVDSITTSTQTVTVDDLVTLDQTTANFTGTLQNGGSDVVVDTDIGSTVQAYDADTAKTDVAQTYTAAQRGTVGSGTTSGTSPIEITFDFNTANNFAHTLTGTSKIMNPSNLTAGQAGAIAITNGSTAYAVSYDTAWKFEGGAPTFGSTTGAVSTLVYYVVSSTHVAAKLISEPAS